MIHFNFLIKNPYSSIKWDNIYSRDFKISKNKSIDISLDQDETIIHLGFNIRVKEDHSGFGLVNDIKSPLID